MPSSTPSASSEASCEVSHSSVPSDLTQDTSGDNGDSSVINSSMEGDPPSCLLLVDSAWPAERREAVLRRMLHCEGNLPATEVNEQWSTIMANVLPFKDWIAAVLGPRNICKKFVDVKQVDFKNLTADVHELDMGEEEEEDSVVIIESVPLMSLRPINDTDTESKKHDIESMSEHLEHLHFFYTNLWLPWDEDDDGCEDWVEEHLANRMQLWQRGPDTKEAIRMRQLVEEFAVIREEVDELKADRENQDGDEDAATVMAIEYLLDEQEQKLRREADLLENAALSHALRAKKLKERAAERKQAGVDKMHHLVTGSDKTMTLQQHLDFIKDAGEMIGDGKSNINLVKSLSDALESALNGDVIVLAGGDDICVDSVNGFSGEIKSVQEVKIICLEAVSDDAKKAIVVGDKVELISS